MFNQYPALWNINSENGMSIIAKTVPCFIDRVQNAKIEADKHNMKPFLPFGTSIGTVWISVKE